MSPNSEVIFQGKVWSWELDIVNQRFVIKDTGNVFAKVTAVHKEAHEGDVLASTVRYEACSKTGIITGSEEHPFFVLDVEDYIPMVDLKPGMALKTDNGTQATVVELKPLLETMELYNLTVWNRYKHNFMRIGYSLEASSLMTKDKIGALTKAVMNKLLQGDDIVLIELRKI